MNPSVKRTIFLLVSILAIQTCKADMLNEIQPVGLQCEYLTNPLGIDTNVPRLSWEFASDTNFTRGTRQTVYQVIVASSEALLIKDKGDLWDSGKVTSH